VLHASGDGPLDSHSDSTADVPKDTAKHNAASGHQRVTQCTAEVLHLDWTTASTEAIEELDIDCVISCDTTYIPEHHASLAHMYRLVLEHAQRQCRELVAHSCQPVRNLSTYHHYVQAFTDAGLVLTELDLNSVPSRFRFDRLDIHLARVQLQESQTP